MKTLFFSLVLFFGVSTKLPQLFAQNLVQNGAFQQGLEGWKVLTAQPDAQFTARYVPRGSKATQEYGLKDNQVETNFVALNGQSSIEQSIATEVGKRYTLVFAVALPSQAKNQQMIVSLNGQPKWTRTLSSNGEKGSFQHYYFHFEATSPQTVLSFYATPIGGEATSSNEGLLLSDIICNLEEEVELKLNYQY
jgi:hypothetical protein